MVLHSTTPDVYGPGTFTDTEFIPVPKDCRRVLAWLASVTPGFTKDSKALENVHFHGSDMPALPGPLKPQVLSAVLFAMAGIVAREICTLKSIDTGKVFVNTDQAALYPASASIFEIDGKMGFELAQDGSLWKLGTDLDKGAMTKNAMHYRSWSIYPTRDKDIWFQVMGNLDPPGFLRAFVMDSEAPVKSNDEAYELQKVVFSKYSARELEMKCIEHGFVGQTCLSPQAWRNTLMGKTLAGHPLINYRPMPELMGSTPIQFPCTPSDKRALAGIKVVEFSRVIAAPALGAVLPSFGAEVIKLNSPNLADPNALQLTLTAGKYTGQADLNNAEDRKRVHKLVEEADVVVQGFRHGALERKGFGLIDTVAMANKRGKGIVYLDLSCYGPDGTYAERPGYQQIADAASGAAYICGKAYGFEEGVSVLPALPIADMCTGCAGAVAIMLALRDRAKTGGSYTCHAALTSTDTIQVGPEMGLYPPEIVKKIQDTYQFAPMTPDLHVEDLLFVVLEAWAESDLMKHKEFYARFPESPFSLNHTILAPIVHFEDGAADPYWNHSPVPYLHHPMVDWTQCDKEYGVARA
ncbi:hypothetical protein LTR08_009235 [Meristemomyces frigidus]|nr:hypothetical protein LTR08_009235 [Meristemomyces frigidus]